MIAESKNRIHYTEIAAGAIDNKGRLWYSALGFNSLFCFDLESAALEWKGFFPNEGIWRSFLYSNCLIWKSKLVFAPDYANHVAIYDIDSNSFSQIDIEAVGGRMKFHCMLQWDNYVYLFGDMLPYYIRINMNTNGVSKFDDLYCELKEMGGTDVQFYLARNVCVDDGACYYLLGNKANVLIRFNASNLEYSLVRLGDDSGIYNNLYKDGKDVYLVPGINRCFSVWNIENNSLTEFGERISKRGCYNKLFRNDNYLVILPDRENKIGVWSLDKSGQPEFREIDEKYSEGECKKIVELNCSKFPFVFDNDKLVIYFSRNNRQLFVISKKNGDEKSEHLYISREIRVQISKAFSDKFDGTWKENSLYQLEDLCRTLSLEEY